MLSFDKFVQQSLDQAQACAVYLVVAQQVDFKQEHGR